MTVDEFLPLAAMLAMMDGFPIWNEAVAKVYAKHLDDIPVSVCEPMARQVLLKFDRRPSVMKLREWAVSLAPAPAPKPYAHAWKREKVLPAPGFGSVKEARETLHALYEKTAPEGDAAPRPKALPRTGNWGVEYRYPADERHPKGRVERLPARHAREQANEIAAEARRRNPGIAVTLYQAEAGEVRAILRESAVAR